VYLPVFHPTAAVYTNWVGLLCLQRTEWTSLITNVFYFNKRFKCCRLVRVTELTYQRDNYLMQWWWSFICIYLLLSFLHTFQNIKALYGPIRTTHRAWHCLLPVFINHTKDVIDGASNRWTLWCGDTMGYWVEPSINERYSHAWILIGPGNRASECYSRQLSRSRTTRLW